jgi:hypothetical protein
LLPIPQEILLNFSPNDATYEALSTDPSGAPPRSSEEPNGPVNDAPNPLAFRARFLVEALEQLREKPGAKVSGKL